MIPTDRAEYLALIPGAAFVALTATDRGRRWLDDHTTDAVMLGCGGVLAALFVTLDRASWRTVVRAFVLAGTPLAIRAAFRRLASK